MMKLVSPTGKEVPRPSLGIGITAVMGIIFVLSPNREITRSRFDEVWTRWNEGLLTRLEDSGYEMATLGDLLAAVPAYLDQPLPPLVEGSWNPKQSGGVLRWMGAHSNLWENDNFILTTIARSRLRLIEAERKLQITSGSRDKRAKEFAKAWRAVLKAQCSDFLGWNPSPIGLATGFQAVEMALNRARTIMEAEIPWDIEDNDKRATLTNDCPGNCQLTSPALFGSTGEGEWSQLYSDCWIWEAGFVSVEQECGVSFELSCNYLEFSPSGDETHVLRIPLALLKPEVISLPLSNGLIKLDEEWYLIKLLTRVHLAALIKKEQKKIVFSIRGDYPGHEHAWTFYFVKGDAERALNIANALNGGAHVS